MLNELTHHIPGMGLDDDQENFILDSVESAIKNTAAITDAGNDISVSFEKVIEQLHSLVSQQNGLLDLSNELQKQNEEQSINHNKDDDMAMDVELF